MSVKVWVHAETKAPIAGAQVRLGIYGAETDAAGAAIMRVPKGAFPLVVARLRLQDGCNGPSRWRRTSVYGSIC